MSYYDYEVSRSLTQGDWPFNAIIMAAMRQADTVNLRKLQRAWPQIWGELRQRYDAPGGLLEGELEPGLRKDMRRKERQ